MRKLVVSLTIFVICLLATVRVMAVGFGSTDRKTVKPEENKFYNLRTVGNVTCAGNSIVAEKDYRDLADCEWVEKCTANSEKAEGTGIKFLYPSKMNCTSGTQPHVVCKVTKTFRNPVVVVGVNFGVWHYDENILMKLKRLNQFDVRGAEFLALANSMTEGRGRLIGAGVTTIGGRHVMWVTLEHEKGRSGVVLRTVARNYLIPLTGGRLMMASMGLTTFAANGWPYRDFELLNTTGMRIIQSITFMNESQVEAPRVVCGCKKRE